MAKRTLLKIQGRHELFDIPTDEDSLIRHYSLSPADRLEIELRRRKQNQLGFAVQLCLMRYPGRALLPNEVPTPMLLNYIAEQINMDPRLFNLYATREETRTACPVRSPAESLRKNSWRGAPVLACA